MGYGAFFESRGEESSSCLDTGVSFRQDEGGFKQVSIHSESLGFLQLRSQSILSSLRSGIGQRAFASWFWSITWSCGRY